MSSTRAPDITDGNIALYRVTPPGKKMFYEIYDGPPNARIRIRMFPDILNSTFDEYSALQMYKGESRLIRGVRSGTNVTYPAYICLRRTKSKLIPREEGDIAEDHTAELGIGFPKYGKLGKSKTSGEIGYRLWAGANEPVVDFIFKGRKRPTLKDCFTLLDAGSVVVGNIQYKLRKLEESLYEGKPVRLARVSETSQKKTKTAKSDSLET